MPTKDLPLDQQQKIIEEFKTNRDVFGQVYEFYYEMILRYLIKRTMSADIAYDLTAETFIKAFEHFDRFKWQGFSIKVWLYRIAINNLKNYRKKPMASPLTEAHENDKNLVEDVKEELQELDKSLFGDDELSQLSDAIATLKPEYQNVVSLYYFSNMSQEEIGKTIKKSTSSVKSIMHRAMKHLRQMLSPNFSQQYE